MWLKVKHYVHLCVPRWCKKVSFRKTKKKSRHQLSMDYMAQSANPATNAVQFCRALDASRFSPLENPNAAKTWTDAWRNWPTVRSSNWQWELFAHFPLTPNIEEGEEKLYGYTTKPEANGVSWTCLEFRVEYCGGGIYIGKIIKLLNLQRKMVYRPSICSSGCKNHGIDGSSALSKFAVYCQESQPPPPAFFPPSSRLVYIVLCCLCWSLLGTNSRRRSIAVNNSSSLLTCCACGGKRLFLPAIEELYIRTHN